MNFFRTTVTDISNKHIVYTKGFLSMAYPVYSNRFDANPAAIYPSKLYSINKYLTIDNIAIFTFIFIFVFFFSFSSLLYDHYIYFVTDDEPLKGYFILLQYLKCLFSICNHVFRPCQICI